jgi:acyl-CoA thioesterase-1
MITASAHMIAKRSRLSFACLVLLTMPACRPRQEASHEAPGPTPRPEAPAILFVGTSLTAGYGLQPEQAFPARIQSRIDAEGLAYRVVNAGVSGETSAGALRRIDWLLRQPVAILVLETGANDGLRGQDVEATRANIQAIFDRLGREPSPPKVLLLGMEAPPNLGADYARRFRGIFAELARRNQAPFVPFLLDGVAGLAPLNQADGIHPTAEGHERVADTVWKTLRPLLTPATGALSGR